MALSAVWFTIIAATYDDAEDPADAQFPWPSFISSSLIFFGGFFWLVLDSWYHGRAWWKLLSRSSGYLSATGAAHLLGLTGLVPIAIGIWGWTFAMAWVVFGTDFIAEGDGAEAGLGVPPAEYIDDAPRKLPRNELPCSA
jgi:hypothetical protein